MLNRTGVRKETYGNDDQILWAIGENVSLGVVVSNAAFVTEGGKKIVKKGTPLAGNLDARTTPFTVVPSAGTGAVGILVHDVDVTDGNGNGTLLISGFVNTARIDSVTLEKITTEVKEKLPRITFVKV